MVSVPDGRESGYVCAIEDKVIRMDFEESYEDFEEESEFIARGEKRYIVLVIYDIVDNRKRYRMVKCLEKYGLRVQKSAFEAFLTRKQYEKLMAESSRIINKEEDSLRIYLLAEHTSVRSWGLGDRHLEDVIIF